MKKRLIDANALYTEVTEKYKDIVAGCYPYNIVAYDMAQLVKDAPTVDAVEVVRCKDCKHCTPSENIIGGYGDCNRFERDNDNSIVCEDDFCSCGERKDDAKE